MVKTKNGSKSKIILKSETETKIKSQIQTKRQSPCLAAVQVAGEHISRVTRPNSHNCCTEILQRQQMATMLLSLLVLQRQHCQYSPSCFKNKDVTAMAKDNKLLQ